MLKYGKVVTAERLGPTLLMTVEEKIQAAQHVDKVITLTESVQVDKESDIIAHFLRMCDDMKDGKIDNIGLQCIRHRGNGTTLRIEKTWTVKHLP